MLNACPAQKSYDIYEPRNPRKSHYYQCVEAHFEELERGWDDRYQNQYEFFLCSGRDLPVSGLRGSASRACPGAVWRLRA